MVRTIQGIKMDGVNRAPLWGRTGGARLLSILLISIAMACAGQAHAVDQGEAYSACKTEEASVAQHEKIVAPCFEFQPGLITYAWQSYISGSPHSGTTFAFDSYCTSRLNQTTLISSAPPSVMCTTGCSYSPSGQVDTPDGPAVVYGASGSVCPKLANAADPDKNQGPPCAGDCPVGDPINAGSGNKYESRTEFRGGGPFPLEFTWYYNSLGEHSVGMPFDSVMGANRTHTYARFLSVQSPSLIYVSRPEGAFETYRKVGSDWTAEADNTARLRAITDPFGSQVYERRDASGEVETYRADGRLVAWTNRDGLAQTLNYGGSGLLASVTDPGGRVLGFEYDSQSRLKQLNLPDGRSIGFAYDSSNYLGANLASVTYPDQTAVSYLYNETGYVASASPHALTGVIDEGGARYASTTYDAAGRATSTYLATGVDRYSAQYTPAADRSYSQSTVVTLPLGAQETRTYTTVEHRPRQASTSLGGAGVMTRSTTTTYDLQGRLDRQTDALGNVTNFDFDSRGRLSSLTAAENTPASKRTIQIDWDPTFDVPVERRTLNAATQLVAKEAWTYNNRGQVLSASVMDVATGTPARTSLYRYCEVAGNTNPGDCPFIGLLTAVDGPRTDVNDTTAFLYYFDDQCAAQGAQCVHRKGDLWKVSNPLGQAVEFMNYDAAGRPTKVKDENGVITDLEYSPRGWLTSRKVRGTDDSIEGDDAISSIEYWPTGDVRKLTSPDGVSVRFDYDAAHRLTDITDSLGNAVHYILDNAGNRSGETFSDANGSVRHSLSRIYSSLGQLTTIADAASTPTDFTYDLNGNLNTSTDPLHRVSDNTTDALGRLVQVIANTAGTSSDRALTRYEYDARDNLTAVVDPKGLRTEYAYNSFGERTQLKSPDTLVTTYEYDQAGNRSRATDARGKVAAFTYDALGRVTGQLFPTTTQNVYFDYDDYSYGILNGQPATDCAEGETFGIGRLAGIRDESGGTRYCYDRRGNPVRKVQSVAGGSKLAIGATYNGADRVVAMSYPSGAVVAYLRNPDGQVSRIDVVPKAGQPQATLVSAVTYLPFGPTSAVTFGNGRTLTKSYDGNYDIDKVTDSATSNPVSEDFGVDVAGRITSLAERTSATVTAARTYSYDGLDRLTGQKNASKLVEGFTYDATGNRLSKTVGNKTTNYGYPATDHRLTAVGNTARTYDANGNTTAIGSGRADQAFVYDDRNRMRDYKLGASVKASYRYNGLGEQVLRIDSVTPANSRQYVYDGAGHLLGEYTTAGVRIQEYVWLDEILVGILSDHDASTYQYVETDHLGTPRAVIHPVKNTIIWRWDANETTFGEHAPQGDPDNNRVTYTLNLRYPGQRQDPISGLTYNYFRDYDAATGRYVESDPIGLSAGSSTYGYVRANPFVGFDSTGLQWQWGDSLPDAVVNPLIGAGGAATTTLTLGFLDPSNLGIDSNNADHCSLEFRAGQVVGGIAGFVATGGILAGAAKRLVAARGTNLVYQSIGAGGEIQYVGITGNLEARALQHFGSRGIIIDAIPGLDRLSRYDARAIEQVLIDFHGFAKTGGTLINKINSIAKLNPIYEQSVARGTALLRQAGYPGF